MQLQSSWAPRDCCTPLPLASRCVPCPASWCPVPSPAACQGLSDGDRRRWHPVPVPVPALPQAALRPRSAMLALPLLVLLASAGTGPAAGLAVIGKSWGWGWWRWWRCWEGWCRLPPPPGSFSQLLFPPQSPCCVLAASGAPLKIFRGANGWLGGGCPGSDHGSLWAPLLPSPPGRAGPGAGGSRSRTRMWKLLRQKPAAKRSSAGFQGDEGSTSTASCFSMGLLKALPQAPPSPK